MSAGTPAGGFELGLEQQSGYAFVVHFDKETHQPLLLDEPPPLGQDQGPNPSRLLAAAIGDCLAASLVFCLQKQGVKLEGLTATIKVELVRNEHKRLRIGGIDVRLHPVLPADAPALVACTSLFEDFCVVTQSVRQGLDVRVAVEPVAGAAVTG